MLIEFLTSRFSYVLDGLVGIVAFILLVRYANRSLGIKDFRKDVIDSITKDARAEARYFGLRFVGMAIVFGCIVLAGSIQ